MISRLGQVWASADSSVSPIQRSALCAGTRMDTSGAVIAADVRWTPRGLRLWTVIDHDAGERVAAKAQPAERQAQMHRLIFVVARGIARVEAAGLEKRRAPVDAAIRERVDDTVAHRIELQGLVVPE